MATNTYIIIEENETEKAVWKMNGERVSDEEKCHSMENCVINKILKEEYMPSKYIEQ